MALKDIIVYVKTHFNAFKNSSDREITKYLKEKKGDKYYYYDDLMPALKRRYEQLNPKNVGRIFDKKGNVKHAIVINDAKTEKVYKNKDIIKETPTQIKSFDEWYGLKQDGLKRKSIVVVSFGVQYSDVYEDRNVSVDVKGKAKDEIKQIILDAVAKYVEDPNINTEIQWDGVEPGYRPRIKKTRDINDMKLKKATLSLDSKVVDDNVGMDDLCVKRYLTKFWKMTVELPESPSVNDIYKFCEVKDLSMNAYGINGRLLKKRRGNPKYRILKFIAYDSHLYGLNASIKEFIKKVKRSRDCPVESIGHKIAEIYEKDKIIPRQIKLNNNSLFSCMVGDTVFFENPDYNQCKEILTKLGLESELKLTTNMRNMIDIIEGVYKMSKLESYCPNLHDYKVTDLHYKHDDYDKLVGDEILGVPNIHKIDANKFYPDILENLDYLIRFDYKSDNVYHYTSKHKIMDHFLYLVEIEKYSFLMHENGVVTGKFVKECEKRGVKLDIIGVMECEKMNNEYSALIQELFEVVPEHAKQILVPLFGKMQAEYYNTKRKEKAEYLVNNNDMNQETSTYLCLPGDYSVKIAEGKYRKMKITSKKPISIQIKEEARLRVFDQIQKIEGTVIRIVLDSIAFISKTNPFENSIEKGKWKHQVFKKDDHNTYVRDINVREFMPCQEYDGTLCQAYAGAGKTTYILNEICSKFKNVLVLTPTHTTRVEFLKKGINCEVIQTYTNGDHLPEKCDAIVFDEIGMFGHDMWGILIQCSIRGDKVFAFGDFNQLPPVNVHKKLNKKHFLDMVFKERITLNENYRNNFDKKYYDKLIWNKDLKFAVEQVDKHQSHPLKSEVVICYKNSTVDKYNDLIMKRKGVEFGEVGSLVVCKTNKLAKYGIYNNFVLNVVAKDESVVEFDLGLKLPLKLFKLAQYKDEEKVSGYFKPGYARTLHGVQGCSLKSFHYAKDDYEFLERGNVLYTVISRLTIKNI